MKTEEYTETEQFRGEALLKLLECDTNARACQGLADRLDAAYGELKDIAHIMNIQAPKQCPRLKEARSILYDMATELKRLNAKWIEEGSQYYRTVVADDPLEEEICQTK